MKKNIISLVFFLAGFFLLLSCNAPSGNNSNSGEPEILYSKWMADSEIRRNPEGWTLDFNPKPKWEYTHGLVMLSMLKLYQSSGEQRFLDYVLNFARFMINEEGEILTYKQSDYNIDRVNGGKFLIELYKITGDQRYKLALEQLRDQMREHPRTSEGGFWHKKVYPHQMWLDGLYMGSPFLAQYASEFDEPTLFDDVINQFYLIDKHAYGSESGLYHHAWDESREQRWADPLSGLSKNFWGRSIGWFSMAVVDALDFIPKNHKDRDLLISIASKIADGVMRYQHETGVWYQVIDQGDREGNYLEASVSAMLTYFLLKGYSMGYLTENHHEAGLKAYRGILEEFIREDDDGGISLTRVCGVAGLGGNPYRDGSYEYYINEIIRDNDPKGVGPFILASLWYEKIADKAK